VLMLDWSRGEEWGSYLTEGAQAGATPSKPER